ncbi:hypothetical protein D3C85_1078260 [compost metagenome]
MLVVVTFIFELQRQRVPGRLVSYTAEEGGGAAEVGVAIEFTRVCNIVVRGRSVIEFIIYQTQGVADIATVADVAPSQAEAQVDITQSLVANKIFTGKETGTTNVSRPQRNLRHPMTFFDQAHFGVDSLVLIALVATQFF